LVTGGLLHFHDELLSAALIMILHAPAEFVDLDTQLAAAALALRTGVEARAAVTAIYRALYRNTPLSSSQLVSSESSSVDSLILKSHLPELLPLLDTYLGASGGDSMHEASGEIALRSKTGLVGGSSSSKSKKARDIVQDRLRLSSLNNPEDDASSLNTTTVRTIFDAEEEGCSMQRAVTRLLGRLGGLNQLLLVEPTEAVQGSLSWGDTDSLIINVPFPQMVTGEPQTGAKAAAGSSASSMDISVALDHLLPRVTELCSTQSDGSSVSSGE
jgi:hypothetical protein